MRVKTTTVVPQPPRRASIWTALVLLLSLIGTFAIIALLLVAHHSWTDALMAWLPLPGTAGSLAADPSLSAQIRIAGGSAWFTRLADRTPVLVARVTVVNDSPLPVRSIVVEANAYKGGRTLALSRAGCGTAVSKRLLGRLSHDELNALLRLAPDTAPALPPAQRVPCQVAFAGLQPGVEEVRVRIVSAEPLPGHPRPRFHLGE